MITLRLSSIALLLAGAAVVAQPASAQDNPAFSNASVDASVPAAIGAPSFAAAMAMIRAQRWDTARATIDAMQDRDLAAFARAELFLAAGSPHVDGEQLRLLLNQAPNLPQAAQLSRLAERRGMSGLPSLPFAQQLSWAGASPRRGNPRSVNDATAGVVRSAIQQRITEDDPTGAESILAGVETSMTPEALTEWRQREIGRAHV